MKGFLLQIFLAVLQIHLIFAVSQLELEALEDFYTSTNGDDWFWRKIGPHWNFTLKPINPCNADGTPWQGITCSKSSSLCANISCSIVEISLPLYHLQGSVPSTMSFLTSLTALILNANFLIGSFPYFFNGSFGTVCHV